MRFVVLKAEQERNAAIIRAEGESEAAKLISEATRVGLRQAGRRRAGHAVGWGVAWHYPRLRSMAPAPADDATLRPPEPHANLAIAPASAPAASRPGTSRRRATPHWCARLHHTHSPPHRTRQRTLLQPRS